MDHKTPEQVDGERVRQAIAEANLSERSVSEQIGVPWTTFLRKLRGLTPFTSTDLRRLGRVLGVHASSFLTEDVAA